MEAVGELSLETSFTYFDSLWTPSSPFELLGSILSLPLLSSGESPPQAHNAFIMIVTACCILPRSLGPHNIYIYIYIIFFNTSPTYNFFLSTSLMSKALRFDKIHYTSNSSQNRSTSCRFSPPHPLVITSCSSQTFNLLHTSIEIGLVVHDKCDVISPAVLGSCFAILYIIT